MTELVEHLEIYRSCSASDDCYWLVCFFSFGILAPVTTAGIYTFLRKSGQRRQVPGNKGPVFTDEAVSPVVCLFYTFCCIFSVGFLLLVLPE